MVQSEVQIKCLEKFELLAETIRPYLNSRNGDLILTSMKDFGVGTFPLSLKEIEGRFTRKPPLDALRNYGSYSIIEYWFAKESEDYVKDFVYTKIHERPGTVPMELSVYDSNGLIQQLRFKDKSHEGNFKEALFAEGSELLRIHAWSTFEILRLYNSENYVKLVIQDPGAINKASPMHRAVQEFTVQLNSGIEQVPGLEYKIHIHISKKGEVTPSVVRYK